MQRKRYRFLKQIFFTAVKLYILRNGPANVFNSDQSNFYLIIHSGRNLTEERIKIVQGNVQLIHNINTTRIRHSKVYRESLLLIYKSIYCLSPLKDSGNRSEFYILFFHTHIIYFCLSFILSNSSVQLVSLFSYQWSRPTEDIT